MRNGSNDRLKAEETANLATEDTESTEGGGRPDPALDPSPSLLPSSALSVPSVARSPAVVLALLAGFWLCLVMACAAPGAKSEGGKVSLAKGASAGDIDTAAESASQSPKVEKPTADTVNVNTTYGSLDRNVARAGVLAGLVFMGLLLAAAAAPAPPDVRLQVGLYVAALGCWVVALVMAWRFWPVD